MKFTLEELIECPAKKKAQKRKRNDGEAKEDKKGTAAIKEVPNSLEGIIEGVSGVLTTKPKVGVSMEETKMASPTQ